MLYLFRHNKPTGYLYVLLYALLWRGLQLLFPLPLPPFDTGSGILMGWWPTLASQYPWLIEWGGFVFVVANALLLTAILNRWRMTGQATWMPAMAYVVLCALVPTWGLFGPGLLGTTFLLAMLYQMMQNYEEVARPYVRILYTGIWLGMAVMVLQPMVVLLPWQVLALLILRQFKLREILILVIGWLLPWYLLFTGLFVTGNLHMLAEAWEKLVPALPEVTLTQYQWAVLAILGVYFAWALSRVIPVLAVTIIQVRKQAIVWIFLLVFLCTMVFLAPDTALTMLAPVVVPTAYLLALRLQTVKRKAIAEAFHLTLVAIAILAQYLNFAALKSASS